jgi:hypothetical protein
MASPGGGDKHSEEWRPVSLVDARSAYPTIGRSLWGQRRDTRSSIPEQLMKTPTYIPQNPHNPQQAPDMSCVIAVTIYLAM